MRKQTHCYLPRAKRARGKVLGALPRIPARGTPPETPGPLSRPLQVPERSSPSRVLCAAHKRAPLTAPGRSEDLLRYGKAGHCKALLRLSPASSWSAPSCATTFE
jgi:hypothetical protein